ncbi:hypothetical protein KKB83_00820 [Patescibacteria group bacterium]|nr:hypothetical protein [Patescibacteria group bacterium]
MYVKRTEERVTQGDILAKLEYRFPVFQAEKVEVAKITLSYAVVLTQDCDLEQDYKCRACSSQENSSNDKFLQSVLICPAYLAEQFKTGIHLEKLGLKMNTWSSEQWKSITQNQNQRLHFLSEDPALEIEDLIIDFKHYYTIPRDEMYESHKKLYLASLEILFREDLSHRFTHYLSRIGLPTVNKSDQGSGDRGINTFINSQS